MPIATNHRDSLPTELTRKERELLELLESEPGTCFSRKFLLKQIWGYNDDTRTRTVDVHVSRLRKKLAGTGIEIHTVVRRGYVLQRHRSDGAAHTYFDAGEQPPRRREASAADQRVWVAGA